ncbi:MAG: SRPBCC family protein [Planctomycetota bacterium]
MKIWRLEATLWVPQPLATVFPFFADARNLERLTPDWVSFRILSPTPVAMAVGARIDYRIAVHGLPLRWRTRIARWEPPHAFADEQQRGPYARWFHTHTFTAERGGTRLGDRVEMRPRGGPLAGLVMRAFVRRDVERIFTHRAEVMAREFGGDAATATLRWEVGETAVGGA